MSYSQTTSFSETSDVQDCPEFIYPCGIQNKQSKHVLLLNTYDLNKQNCNSEAQSLIWVRDFYHTITREI